MLQRQGGDYCRVLGVGFGSAPNLGAIYEDLGYRTILKPANAAGVDLAITLEPVQPVWPAVLEPLARGGHDDAPVPAIRPKMPF
jgi:hypothetical protein